MKEWIAISDRKPTIEECGRNHGWFVVWTNLSKRAYLSRYDGYQDEYSYDHGWKYGPDVGITHFMPLPDGP